MTILVTGATGTIGRQVVEQLVKRGADVRVLVRDPDEGQIPGRRRRLVQGDLLDIDSLRGAFSGVSTLFLLNAVVPDEFTQALTRRSNARRERPASSQFVYLSVIHSDVATSTCRTSPASSVSSA
ncbi:SDR family oxidoreductase [Bradyrhizobium betae]